MGNEESRGRGHRVKKGECVCVCVHACWLIWGIERVCLAFMVSCTNLSLHVRCYGALDEDL